MKKNISTIIEITNSHVKFFQFKDFRNERTMVSFEANLIQKYTDDEINDVLIESIRSKNIDIEELVFIVPRRFTILKQMHLPSQNEEEIIKMVELQLVNKIPYSLEDVSYHRYPLGEDSSGHTQVLMIVVHKEVSDRYLNIFKKVGLNLSRLTLSSFGILEWLEYQRGKNEVKGDGPVAVIDVDMDCTEICFCHQGKLLFSRNFDGGAKDMSQENILHLTKQVEMSLGMYQKENLGPPIQEIVIASTLDKNELLREKLESVLQIDTKTLNPVKNISYQEGKEFSIGKEEMGISLSAGLGLGLSDIKKTINIAPQKVHEAKRGKKRKSQWLQLASLVVVVCILGVSYLWNQLYRKTAQLNALKEKVMAIKPKASKALQQMQFIESFNEEFGKRVFISDLLYDLYGLVPLEISFRSLHLNDEGHLTIRGYAQAGGSVSKFQTALMRSTSFKDVNLQFATKRKIFKMEVTDFKIDTQLTIAEKAQHD